jgi:hypothetical protein
MPDLDGGQGPVPEKLALEYDACQIHLASLTMAAREHSEAPMLLAGAVSRCQRWKYQQFVKLLGL